METSGKLTCSTCPTCPYSRLSGQKLIDWCHHMYRVLDFGFECVDDEGATRRRLMNPDLRCVVFLDLDETLTATNGSPSDEIQQPRRSKEVIRYMQKRVPLPLRKRIKSFLEGNVVKNTNVDWFILTDNVFPTTKCTVKLAFDIDTQPGTIIDREMRRIVDPQNGKETFVTKAMFIQRFIEARLAAGLNPSKVIFADNADYHRIETEALTNRKDCLVCCNDLKTGLEEHHIEQMQNFISEHNK